MGDGVTGWWVRPSREGAGTSFGYWCACVVVWQEGETENVSLMVGRELRGSGRGVRGRREGVQQGWGGAVTGWMQRRERGRQHRRWGALEPAGGGTRLQTPRPPSLPRAGFSARIRPMGPRPGGRARSCAAVWAPGGLGRTSAGPPNRRGVRGPPSRAYQRRPGRGAAREERWGPRAGRGSVRTHRGALLTSSRPSLSPPVRRASTVASPEPLLCAARRGAGRGESTEGRPLARPRPPLLTPPPGRGLAAGGGGGRARASSSQRSCANRRPETAPRRVLSGVPSTSPVQHPSCPAQPKLSSRSRAAAFSLRASGPATSTSPGLSVPT